MLACFFFSTASSTYRILQRECCDPYCSRFLTFQVVPLSIYHQSCMNLRLTVPKGLTIEKMFTLACPTCPHSSIWATNKRVFNTTVCKYKHVLSKSNTMQQSKRNRIIVAVLLLFNHLDESVLHSVYSGLLYLFSASAWVDWKNDSTPVYHSSSSSRNGRISRRWSSSFFRIPGMYTER